jgi:hypothetical protein
MNLKLLALVLKFHAGQARVGNREDGRPDPQVEHLLRVLVRVLGPAPHYPESLLIARMNALPIVVDVALGHDLLEDTSILEGDLAEVVHPYALDAIKALTRTNTENEQTYQEYIENQVLSHPIASLVKLADLEDNIQNAKESLKVRYLKAKDTILKHWRDRVVAPVADQLEDNEKILGE